ncbi:hypothetical protein JCM15519_24490 [Fundidesulfovibrio butyratiphilus]
MSKSTPFAAEKATGERYACGRPQDRQVQDILAYGNHGASPVLRAGALAAHDIVAPKPKAENGVFFGCYRPFTTPYWLQAALGCLDLLGVSNTFFDKEYCCGLPLIMQTVGEDQQAARAACREFNRLNTELAESKGASTLAYCCVGCAYTAKGVAADPDRHVYILDLIAQAMPTIPVRTDPARFAYFEGCHVFYREQFPGVDFDWPAYRTMFDVFPDFDVVDLPNSLCCKRAGDAIIDKALEQEVTTLVCACPGCAAGLREKGRPKGVRVKTVTETLLAGLQAGL